MFLSLFPGNYSVLGLRFVFTRRIGHYLTRVYIPAILIACMSWLSFFIDRKSVPARVALSIMTVLTITTLLIGVGQGSLPVVSYVKAVDWYLIFCYIFVFGAFAEYAIVNSIETGHKSTEHRVVRISMDAFVYSVEIKMWLSLLILSTKNTNLVTKLASKISEYRKSFFFHLPRLILRRWVLHFPQWLLSESKTESVRTDWQLSPPWLVSLFLLF